MTRGKREAKRTGLGRRLLSVFLAVVMCTSMLQLTAFAATGNPNTTQAQEQILGGTSPEYYTWNPATGTFGEDTTAVAEVKNTTSNPKVTLSKTIAPTGVENEFDITLQVVTKEAIETTITSPEAAVVLVLDTSSSMAACTECGNGAGGFNSNHKSGCSHSGSIKEAETRLASAKIAAKDFLRTYAGFTTENGTTTFTAPGAARKVAIVAYNSSASTLTLLQEKAWIDVAATTAEGADSILDTIDSKIDNLTRATGTNTDAGLKAAQTLLADSAVSGIGNKFLVLMTDGEPRDNTGDNLSYGFPDGYTQKTGNDSKDYNNPAQRANYIRTNLNTTFYSISLSAGDSASKWLDSISNRCVTADNSSQLHLAFEDIINRMKLAVDAWKVTDPMGQYMALKNVNTKNHAANAVAIDGNVLSWNLRNDLLSSATEIRDSNNNLVTNYEPGMDCTITYTLTYTVKLDVAAIIAAAEAAVWSANPDATQADLDNAVEAALDEYYPTNGKTQLDYYLTKTVNGNQFYLESDGETVITDASANKLLTLYFKVPAVKGYADKLAFTKVGPKNEKLMGAQFTLTNAADTWSAAATSDNNGNVVFTKWIPSGDTYTLTETQAPAGYKKVESIPSFTVVYGKGVPSFNGGLVDPVEIAETDVTITKVWQMPADESTPASITVTLKQNGENFQTKTITTAELDADSTDTTWKYTFTGLPANDNKGDAYIYTVEEEAMSGWTASYDDQNPLIITNTANGTTSVSVTKNWILPEGMQNVPAVTVNLLADNGPTGKTVTLTSGETYVFEDLPKYNANGQLIDYTVEEAQGTYQMANAIEYGTDGAINTAVITNTVADEKTTVSGTKSWNDAGTGRPDSITVILCADGDEIATADVTAENGWKYSFTDLPRYEFTRDGNNNIIAVREINYTVNETDVEGYVSVVDGYNITNTRTGKVNLTINKVWIDADEDGRSDVEVQLYANGQAYGDPVLVTEEDDYTCTVEVPKYGTDGLEITWSVMEAPIPEGYVPSYSAVVGDGEDNLSVTITNTQKIINDTLNITVSKVWQQPSDVATKTATFQLYRDGEAMENKTLEISGNDSGTFSGLPKYKMVTNEAGETDLVEIRYDVVEQVPSGYECILANQNSLVVNDNGDMLYQFVNTIQGTISVSVQKQWVKPATVETPDVTFTVLRTIGSGEAETVGTIELKSGETSGKLSGLDEYDEYGQRYIYTVKEESLPGYSTTVETEGALQANGNYVYDVTNTIEQAYVGLEVSKTWNDGGLVDSERPSVKLLILQNGNAQSDVRWVEFSYVDGAVMATTQDGTTSEATVTGNTWSYKFTNLPKYSQDLTTEYTYSVDEDVVPAGYTKTVSTTSVTNTRIGTIDIPVTKYWVDPVGTDRPEITLVLSGTDASSHEIVMDDVDGVVTATLDGAALEVAVADNAWTVTVAGLPQYDASGAVITYTLSEPDVPTGYTSSTVEGQRFAIRNTIEQQETSVGATKRWANMVEVQGAYYTPEYPESITVALFRNGVKVDGTQQTVTKESNYEIAEYTGLPKYASDGSVFSYQVMELNADGSKVDNNGTISFGTDNDYTVTYGDGTITNTFIVPAKYLWIVKTNYVHYNCDGTTISSFSNQTQVYPEVESQTITVNPADYATCPQDGKTYNLDTSKPNITSVELVRVNQLYELVINYILVEECYEDPTPPSIIIPEPPVPQDPAPQPAPEVVIPEEDVPLVEIPEEDVPMADVPKTGDASALWLALSVLSGTGLAGVNFLGRKKRDEEI